MNIVSSTVVHSLPKYPEKSTAPTRQEEKSENTMCSVWHINSYHMSLNFVVSFVFLRKILNIVTLQSALQICNVALEQIKMKQKIR